VRSSELDEVGKLTCSADERSRLRRQTHLAECRRSLRVDAGSNPRAGHRRAGRAAREQRLVLSEDRLVELPQLRGRLDPELVDEHGPSGTVPSKRLRLTSSSVQSQHQLTLQPFAIGVLTRKALELAEHLGLPTQHHLDGDPFLKRGSPQLAEPGDLRLGECVVLEVGQDRAAPQLERRAEDCE
jgi:hypothetical protein